MKTWMLLGFILLWFGSAHAQLYKWTDEKGVTRWGDTPPPQMGTVKTEAESKSAPTAGKDNTTPQHVDTKVKNQKNNVGKSSTSGRSLKNIVPLDPDIASRICRLKPGDQTERLIRLFGKPAGRKGPDSYPTFNWYGTQWGVYASFKNGLITSAAALAKNRPSDVHNFKNDPTWKRGITTLPEVESKWGKGILVKANFGDVLNKLHGGPCVKDHVFYLENQKELVTLRFVNNILQ